MLHRKRLFFFFVTALALALSASAQTLRLSLPDAIRRALSGGTQAELARSAQQRAGIAQREALGALLPQVEARLQHYSQSINLETFGFSLPGFPAVVGPFNVTDGQIAAAMQLFNLAALRRYEALREERVASRWDVEQTENDVAGFDLAAIDDFNPIHDANDAACEIVFTLAVHPGHLRSFATEQRAVRGATCAR